MPAVPQYEDQADVGQQLHGRQVAGPNLSGLDRRVVHIVGLAMEASGLHRFGAEALDDPHAAHGLLDHRCQLGRLALDRHGRGVQAGRETLAEVVEQRQRSQGEQRENRIDHHEDHGDCAHRDEVRDGEWDEDDEGLDLLQVGVGPAHEIARLHLVVEREVEALCVGEELLAEVGLDGAGNLERPVAPEAGEGGGRNCRHADRSRPAPQRGGVARDYPVVDRSLHERRDRDLGHGPAQAHHDAERHAEPFDAESPSHHRQPSRLGRGNAERLASLRRLRSLNPAPSIWPPRLGPVDPLRIWPRLGSGY